VLTNPSHPPRTPAEALQAVLMLMNWQTSLVQAAIEMLQASGKSGGSSSHRRPSRGKATQGRQT
jgi:hypothetical protein